MCDNDNPKKSITKYEFELFQSANEYTVALLGVNTYQSKDSLVTRIEFEPTNTYFKLPETYYENLNRQQLLEKLTFQLKDSTNTEKFNSCFFAKAKIVFFETIIWSKQQWQLLVTNKTAYNNGICYSRADGRAISNKSLLGFSSGLTLIIKLQMLSSAKYFQ